MVIDDEGDAPALIQNNPTIEHFVINLIDTNHGIQVPALLHSLVETFGRDGVDQSVFSDKDFLNWINKRLIDKNHFESEVQTQIGQGVGTQIDQSGDKDSNKDPFVLLVPDKGVF